MCTCFPCFGVTDPSPVEQRCVRPFTISSSQPKLSVESRLLRDQTLGKTAKGRHVVQEHVPAVQLNTYVHNAMDSELVARTKIDSAATEITKVCQNLYLTSFGGLVNLKTIKRYRINQFLNASIDLPIVDFALAYDSHSLRVPITTKEPETLSYYLNDVADRLQESYWRNDNTLIYCHDGTLNSVALAIGYLLKYTDLTLSETLLHIRYSRKSFENANSQLGPFAEPISHFATKNVKNDMQEMQSINHSCNESGHNKSGSGSHNHHHHQQQQKNHDAKKHNGAAHAQQQPPQQQQQQSAQKSSTSKKAPASSPSTSSSTGAAAGSGGGSSSNKSTSASSSAK